MISHQPAGVISPYAIPSKAHAVSRGERYSDLWAKMPESVQTAWCAISHGHGKDRMLGRLDDTTRALSVAGIAGLGGLGLKQTSGGSSLPLWLGGASWLAAMALTPKLLYAAIFLKTGISLDKQYKSSAGEVRPLFQDPNYMPIQVIPEEVQKKLAKRFRIPESHPDRTELLQAKLRQITIQTHAWWMLMAGMATPVIASWLCHSLEDRFKSWLSQLRFWKVQTHTLKPALKKAGSEQLEQAVEDTLKIVLKPGTDVTLLSRWWKQMPKAILQALKLDQISDNAFLKHPSTAARADQVVRYLSTRLQNPAIQETLESTILQQQKALDSIFKPLESLLKEEALGKIPMAKRLKWQEEVQIAKKSAEATLRHFRQLVDLAANYAHSAPFGAQIRQWMLTKELAHIEKLSRLGGVSPAVKAATGAKGFQQIHAMLTQGQGVLAHAYVGKPPAKLLLEALESLTLSRRWLRRFPGYIGGGMILASLLFIGLFLGENQMTSRHVKKEPVNG